jgi:hypothetical protein
MQRRVIALQHLKNARISRRAARDEADARNGLARERQRRVQKRWRIAPLQLMQRRAIALQHLQVHASRGARAMKLMRAMGSRARGSCYKIYGHLPVAPALPQQLHRPRC